MQKLLFHLCENDGGVFSPFVSKINLKQAEWSDPTGMHIILKVQLDLSKLEDHRYRSNCRNEF